MKTILIILVAALLSACNVNQNVTVVDQCLRREQFNECLKAVPTGPVVTGQSDWAEVVKQCSSQAYYASLRLASTIEDGCK